MTCCCAIAKIAGTKMCQVYDRQHGFKAISLMSTSLYGPDDNFDLQNLRMLPALIRRSHETNRRGDAEVVIWAPARRGGSSCTWTTSPRRWRTWRT